MNEVERKAVEQQPLWRRIVDYPLVTMVIAVLLYLLAASVGIAIDSFVKLGKPAGPALRAAIPLVLVVLMYKFVIVRLGARPRDDLRAAGAFRDLGKGIAAGAVLFSAIVGAAAILGVYRIIGKGDSSTILVGLVVLAITPGFTEEILFRGILFRWIEEWGGSWLALLVTSALFGLAHIMNPGATWFSSFAIAVEAGVLLGGAYMLTRNLWMAVGLHAAWNFTQGPIFGVPVSGGSVSGIAKAKLVGPTLLTGGSFGLEASLIALVIATAAGIWFVWLAVRRGELVQPSWVRRRQLNRPAPSVVGSV